MPKKLFLKARSYSWNSSSSDGRGRTAFPLGKSNVLEQVWAVGMNCQMGFFF